MRPVLSRVIFGLAIVLIGIRPGAAEGVADFFQGKTVTIHVAGSVAGPAEVRARALSPYLKKYLPGAPNIIVQVLPGAGGNRAANNLYNLMPKDGTALGLLQSTIAFNQAIAMPGIQYDARRFSYIGSLDPSGQTILVSEATPARSIADAKRHEVVLGSSGLGSSSWIVPALANRYLGTRFKIVTGYTGMSDILLGIERRELDGIAINWHSVAASRPSWRPGQTVFALAQSGLKRDAEWPEAPTLVDLAESEAQRQVVEFYGLSTALGVVLVAPPDVPAERVQALRDAIDKAFVDPSFLAEAKGLGLHVEPRPGAELAGVAAKTLATPPEVIAQMRELLNMQ